MKRKQLIAVLVLLVGVWSMGAQALANEVRTITVWHYTRGESMDKLAAAFMEDNPGYEVVLDHMGDSQGQKFLLHLAAGTGPDVLWSYDPISWALAGAIQPLTPWIERDGLKRSDFIEPAWDQAVWNGEIWALPLYLDANFAMAYNVDMLEAAGVLPPKTIPELDEITPKLTRISNEGELLQAATVPWDVHGTANSMYTWGWAFGGTFFDPETNRVTANHPQVVQALEWMAEPARRWGYGLFSQIFSNLPSGYDTFMARRVAMRPEHQGLVRSIEIYTPDLNYGLADLPYHPDYVSGPQHWIGGAVLVMSSGATDPDAAWEFIRYATADPVGTTKYREIAGVFTGYRASLVTPDLTDDHILARFSEILQNARHARPAIPNRGTLDNEFNNGVMRVIRGEAPARPVLDEITSTVQRELEELMTKN